MQPKRRNFLIGTSLVAASASVAGYKDMLSTVVTMGHKGRLAKDVIYADAQKTEGRVLATSFDKNSDFSIRSGVCNGCTSHCGMRAKIDNETKKVIKATGNPYNPLSSDPWLPYETPLEESFSILGKDSKDAKKYRSTACARGNVVFDKHYDKARVLSPLKRVGKRGEDRWEAISPEQLLEEITKGGDLFGEGNVEGLASIRDLETPINPKDPKCGPKANGLCVLATGDDGRKQYAIHRLVKAFGTQNYMGHTSICGLSMRSGEAAYLGDLDKYPHLKPDFEHCEYLLTVGTAPAQAGNPFKRQAKLLAKARTEGRLKCVTVAPMLTNADSLAAGDRSEWIPVKPGGDLAFMMGLLQVIIEEKLYNENYLSLASDEAMKKANDASWTNATHLVIQGGENDGKILKSEEEYLVFDEESGELLPASKVARAKLFIDTTLEVNGVVYSVKSSMQLLRESALMHSLADYAKESGVDEDRIKKVAREFASHGRKAAVDCHGGTMHTTGFYTTYAIMMLGAMVGNLNYQGGMSAGGGKYKDFNGAKYDLLGYSGKVKTSGYRIDRARVAYEKTAEYAKKVAADQNPYPASDMWYPLTNALESEVIFNSAKEYPYKLSALICLNANFVYGQSGSEHLIELLKDPKKAVPLFISVDPFINETSRYADYIVPDSVMYETWGVVAPWAASQTKANTLRYPTVAGPQERFSNGEPISMDSFIIELGKKLTLPGFGENAIKGKDGTFYSFDKPQDFYIRAFENIALDAGGVPDCEDSEISLAGLEPFIPILKNICGENWRKVAYVMARGGRFEAKEDGYKEGKLSHPYKKPIQVYSEPLGTTRHALTGERFSGVPTFVKARLCKGELLEDIYPKSSYPFQAFSYKSNVISQATAASDLLREIRATTYVDINPISAERENLTHGQKVRLVSPGGSIEGRIRFRHGVYPETIAIEHGAGRDGEGALDTWIDGEKIEGIALRKSGVNINKLGMMDTSRKLATLSDFVIGSNARQALPVRIEVL
ncbi:MAG: tetrathionate reductase subunit TtrA [Campylobacteraceae bacterium]|nr:tetrathionate reductase subunit TtrA [Campylobacteraceae bacterium]